MENYLVLDKAGDSDDEFLSSMSQLSIRRRIVKDSQIRIFFVGQTEPQLRKSLPGWFHDEFGKTSFIWAAPDYYAISEIEGELVGRLGIFNREIEVAGTRTQVGGIGGVITKPEWRLRGIARELMVRAAEFMRSDLGVEFALLLCRREVAPVYAQLGWKRVDGPTVFTQPSGMTAYPRDTMVLTFGKREWPAGTIDLHGLPW